MELIKRSARIKNGGRLLINGLKTMKGYEVKNLGRYTKWIEVFNGELLDKMDLYELVFPDGKHGWALIDLLGQLACVIEPDKNEMMEYLRKHGWKIEQQIDEDEEVEE